MQTAKIKIGNSYAFYRDGKLVRFVVLAVINTKTRAKSANVIQGYVEEDRVPGQPIKEIQMDPENLIGPYEEQAELVERKRQEDAARKAKNDEEARLAHQDRLALYAFVGVAPPKNAEEYSQPFRITGYYGKTVDISGDGTKLIVAKVRTLNPVVEFGPRLVAKE